jgi:transcriptional regulator with XRE-family HTH domain
MPTVFCLREILEARGISQSELARQSGVSFATINRLATNATRQVSLDTLDKIATTLGVDPGALIVREKSRRRK